MNVLPKKLIIGFYVTLASVVLAVCYGAYRVQIQTVAALNAPSLQQLERFAQQPNGATEAAQKERRLIAEQIRANVELRELLDARMQELEKKTAELRNRDAAYEKLRLDADRYLRLAYDLLAQETSGDASRDGEEAALSASAIDDAVAAAAAADQLSQENNELQWSLLQSQETIAELEVEAMVQHLKSVEATRTIVSTGTPAVPAVVAVLANDNAELRTWAATVLGEMGADAVEATPALRSALTDEDANVRDAALRAIDQIEGRL